MIMRFMLNVDIWLGTYFSHHCELVRASAISESLAVPRTALTRLRASNTPFHASLSTRSSCSPRLTRGVPSVSGGRLTPREGGTKLGGGALIADGAMRE